MGSFLAFMRQISVCLFISFWLLLCNAFSASAEPKVVVTLRPLHSLVSMITHGVTEPTLLLEGTQNAHHLSLKPSQATHLAMAEVIFYMDDEFELFLSEVRSANDPAQYVALGAKLDRNLSGNDHHWLHPERADKMLGHIYEVMAEADNKNARRYKINLQKYRQKLKSDIRQWQTIISPAARRPRILATDKNTLTPLADFFSIPHPIVLSAKHGGLYFSAMKKAIDSKAKCILITHDSPDTYQSFSSRSRTALVEADISGNNLEAGDTLYFRLMDTLVQQMKRCLT